MVCGVWCVVWCGVVFLSTGKGKWHDVGGVQMAVTLQILCCDFQFPGYNCQNMCFQKNMFWQTGAALLNPMYRPDLM